MRLCAVLALSAGVWLTLPSGATAATYCAGPGVGSADRCDATVNGVPAALAAASAHPGPDSVRIPDGKFVFDSGLHYSDAGQPGNAVSIVAAPRCFRSSCPSVEIRGGAPGGALMSFGGGGNATVELFDLHLIPGAGATGAVLPPGSTAYLQVTAASGTTGVRLAGTAARPATLSGLVTGEGTAVESPGHGILQAVDLGGATGARIGPQGSLEMRRGEIYAPIGVVGTRAKLVGTTLVLRDPPGGDSPVGLGAECASPGSPDAEIDATNVTVMADPAGGTGVRALARGGDGESCDATVRLNSTAVDGVGTSLEATGEAGSGADPRDGTAQIHARYSAFDPEATITSGPSELATSSPGGNLYGDLRFHREPLAPPYPHIRWDSPLVDRGDPADPSPSEAPDLPVIHGRRDIGAYEYRFEPPFASIQAIPGVPVPPGTYVTLLGRGVDIDPGDEVSLLWRLTDGATLHEPTQVREYVRPGRYTERLTVTDPTGLTDQATVTVVVAHSRVTRLFIDPNRFRTGRRARAARRGATIYWSLASRGRIRFRVDRAVRRRAGRRIRWKRMPGGFARFQYEAPAPTGRRPAEIAWGGRIRGRRLRPGRYRLVATGASGPPRRARFRILR